MLDIREELLTNKLLHIEDSRIKQIRSDWFNSKYSGDVDPYRLTEKAASWFISSQRNTITGIEDFDKCDIIYGCTDYINNFMQKESNFQVLENDYSYYNIFGTQSTKVGMLQPNVPLIVSLPNWHYGNTRPDWQLMLNECESKQIDIHVDAAWYTASTGMMLDVSHPNIKSFALSITKLGFHWNKFGIRFSRKKFIDSITIRNANGWVNLNTVSCANFIIDQIDVDYSWNTHEANYKSICEVLDLQPTDFIHVAKKDGKAVGVANILNAF